MRRSLKSKGKSKRDLSKVVYKSTVLSANDPRIAPDWKGVCENCGASPIVPLTGLCGPCTFGEAETTGGNW